MIDPKLLTLSLTNLTRGRCQGWTRLAGAIFLAPWPLVQPGEKVFDNDFFLKYSKNLSLLKISHLT
jgi:hypothetical protein